MVDANRDNAAITPAGLFAQALYEFHHSAGLMLHAQRELAKACAARKPGGPVEPIESLWETVAEAWAELHDLHKAMEAKQVAPPLPMDWVEPMQWLRRVLWDAAQLMELLGGKFKEIARMGVSNEQDKACCDILERLDIRIRSLRRLATEQVSLTTTTTASETPTPAPVASTNTQKPTRQSKRRRTASTKPLTALQKQALELYGTFNGKVGKIATAMGVTHSTVSQHLDAARRKSSGSGQRPGHS